MAKLNAGRGYAVLELNQVAFPRDGRIEAQLPLDKDVFGRAGQAKRTTGTHVTDTPCEVGMILKVDKANGYVTFATANDEEGDVYALNYSTEHMYDERTPQLNKFCLFPADSSYDMMGYDDFYPRLGYLAVGDRFTTNCVEEDNLDNDDLVYAGTDGYWTNTKPGTDYAGPIGKVVDKNATCPNGIDPAYKIMIVKA